MSTLLSLKNLLRVASSMALLALICTPVHGQWTKVPASAIPRGADGKPNLTAPAPRLSDGRPDLSGIWASSGGLQPEPCQGPQTFRCPVSTLGQGTRRRTCHWIARERGSGCELPSSGSPTYRWGATPVEDRPN